MTQVTQQGAANGEDCEHPNLLIETDSASGEHCIVVGSRIDAHVHTSVKRNAHANHPFGQHVCRKMREPVLSMLAPVKHDGDEKVALLVGRRRVPHVLNTRESDAMQ